MRKRRGRAADLRFCFLGGCCHRRLRHVFGVGARQDRCRAGPGDLSIEQQNRPFYIEADAVRWAAVVGTAGYDYISCAPASATRGAPPRDAGSRTCPEPSPHPDGPPQTPAVVTIRSRWPTLAEVGTVPQKPQNPQKSILRILRFLRRPTCSGSDGHHGLCQSQRVTARRCVLGTHRHVCRTLPGGWEDRSMRLLVLGGTAFVWYASIKVEMAPDGCDHVQSRSVGRCLDQRAPLPTPERRMLCHTRTKAESPVQAMTDFAVQA